MIHDGAVIPSGLVFSGASDGAVRAYAVIALAGLFPPRVGELASAMGVSDRSARRYLAELVEHGYLTLEAKRGGNGGTEYVRGPSESHRPNLADGVLEDPAIGQICHSDPQTPGHRPNLADGSGQISDSSLENGELQGGLPEESNRNPSGRDTNSLTISDPISQDDLKTKGNDRQPAQAQGGSPPVLESLSDPSMDGLFPSGEVPPRAPTPEEILDATAVRILDRLNLTVGRQFKPVQGTLAPIRARLKEKHGEAEFALVIEFKFAEWGEVQHMAQFLRPATLFSPENFVAYLGAAQNWARLGRKPFIPKGVTESQKRDQMRAIDEAKKVDPVLQQPARPETSRSRLMKARLDFYDKHGRAMNREEEARAKVECGIL